jgi:hypothetical protein
MNTQPKILMVVVALNWLATPNIIVAVAVVLDSIAVAISSKTLGFGLALDAVRGGRADPFHATAAMVFVVGGQAHNLDALASHTHNLGPTSNAGFIATDADQYVANLWTIYHRGLVLQIWRKDRVHVVNYDYFFIKSKTYF